MTSRHKQCRLESKLYTEKYDAIHCRIRGMPKQRLCKTGVSMAWLRCEASKLPPREPRRQARQLASDHIIGIILGLAKLGPGCTGSHRVGSELIRLSLLTSRSQYSAFCGDEYSSVSVFMRFKSTVCHSCSKELFIKEYFFNDLHVPRNFSSKNISLMISMLRDGLDPRHNA